ncbi:MAG: efflux RND transporter periplasmic adaptor subunit [bacterium]
MTRLRTALRRFSAIIFIPFPFALCLLLAACSGNPDGGSGGANARLMPAVEAVQARYGSLPLTERLSGLVRARNQVELYPQISAAVVQVYVQNGDPVKSGDPLVRLRDTELRERLKQVEANYQITVAQARQADADMQRIQAELNRSTNLAQKDLISPTEFETMQTQAIAAEAEAELARARVEQAQASVDERIEALSRTVVRAPVDGTVGNRNAEVGMLVTPNTKLFTLGQLDSIRVEVILTDRMLSYIKEDQRSEISSPSIPFGSIDAPVARISPFLHPVTHSTIAEIDLVNLEGALNPGMFVSVDIFYGESEVATLVPLSSLWENPATVSVGVFVTRDSLTGEPVAVFDDPRGGSLTDPVSFEFVPVEVIAQGRMNAGVRGLDPGSWVVTIGQNLLGADTAQARVRPVNWDWVEKLQQLQREDLLEEIIQRQQTGAGDTTLIGMTPAGCRDAA